MIKEVQLVLDSFKSLSFQESLPLLVRLLIYVAAITIYAIFVFKFYRFVASKDIFNLNLRQYNDMDNASLKKFFNFILYILEYLIIFPILAAFWFLILFVLLVFLAKNHSVENILLLSVAVVAIIRVTSYYSEDLSKDLAKMLPFTLLALFLIDSNYISVSYSLGLLKESATLGTKFIYYFIFMIIIEFIARSCYVIYSTMFESKY